MVFRKYVKRLVDTLVSLILLVLLAPFMSIVGLILFLIDGSAVLFVQERVGFDQQPFQILKFRTVKSDDSPVPQADALRITAFGRLLRKNSLDELPN